MRAEEGEWGLLLYPVVLEQTLLGSITMKGKHWWVCLEPVLVSGKTHFLVRQPKKKEEEIHYNGRLIHWENVFRFELKVFGDCFFFLFHLFLID